MTTTEILQARSEAEELYESLKETTSRPVLLWLASFLRRDELAGRVAVGMTTPEEELSEG